MKGLLETVITQLIAGGVTVEADNDDGGSFTVDTEALSWRVHFFVREQTQLVVHGVIPLQSPANRRLALAEFFTRANFGLVMGNFEFDIDTGEMRYKTSLQTIGGSVDPAFLGPVFSTNIATTAEYLPGLFAVIGGGSPTSAIELVESPAS